MSRFKGEGQHDAITVSTRGGESSAKESSYQRALKKLHKAEEDNKNLKNQLQVLQNEKEDLYEVNRGLRSTIDMLKERIENLEEEG